jgi:hypothetical protein
MIHFVLLAGIILGTSAASAQQGGCISREDAVKNIVTFFTNQDFVDIYMEEDGLEWMHKTQPVFASLMKFSPQEFESFVRIYGAHARKAQAALAVQLTRTIVFRRHRYDGKMAWVISMPSADVIGDLIVTCNGRVDVGPIVMN